MRFELKRCSCGSKAIQPQKNSGFGKLTFNYIVHCRNKDCEISAIGKTKKETADKWNARGD